jgi:hypothetical protein
VTELCLLLRKIRLDREKRLDRELLVAGSEGGRQRYSGCPAGSYRQEERPTSVHRRSVAVATYSSKRKHCELQLLCKGQYANRALSVLCR